ncbi:MAG TPA: hypothetical protein VF407_06365, partial [Polyangiaceae bacterium]
MMRRLHMESSIERKKKGGRPKQAKTTKREAPLTFPKNVRQSSDLSSDGPPRRIPAQDRSKARMERILEAA